MLRKRRKKTIQRIVEQAPQKIALTLFFKFISTFLHSNSWVTVSARPFCEARISAVSPDYIFIITNKHF